MSKLIDLFNSLEGKRTYILAILGGIVVLLYLLGFIEAEMANQFMALLGFGSIASLRASKK